MRFEQSPLYKMFIKEKLLNNSNKAIDEGLIELFKFKGSYGLLIDVPVYFYKPGDSMTVDPDLFYIMQTISDRYGLLVQSYDKLFFPKYPLIISQFNLSVLKEELDKVNGESKTNFRGLDLKNSKIKHINNEMRVKINRFLIYEAVRQEQFL